MKVGVVIPAYNVGERIADVLSKSLKHISADRIIVVDDGSTDDTVRIVEGFEVVLCRHPENRGKGEALKTGFRKGLEMGLDAVITLDGDGQHDPDAIPGFIASMERQSSDVVLGRRQFRIGCMPFDRILSNSISSMLVSLVAGRRIFDSQCGFRMIRAKVLDKAVLSTSRFETETELLLGAAQQGFRISNYPVSLVYAGGGSHIRRFQDAVRFCRLLVRTMIHKKAWADEYSKKY